MDELIRIQDNNGKKAVSARELFVFFDVKSDFTHWIKRMFKYGFEEDMDYIPILENRSDGLPGKPRQDFVLTLDCAKEISMLQRNEKGKQARRYFIEVEKKYNKPLSNLDLMEMGIKQLREQEKRIVAVENDVLELKAATKTRPDYFTIVGYATMSKTKVGLKLAAKLGGKASRLCNQLGYITEEIPDPRFGKVKTYPKSILKQVFAEAV